jgi:hypothetical protein
MFGLGNRRSGARSGGGTFGSRNLRNAAIAGLGMLAVRWWRNRQEAGRAPTTGPRTGTERSEGWNSTL